MAGRWRYIDWTHKTSFTEHSLEYLLNAAGFNQVLVCEVPLFKKYEAVPSFFKLGFEYGVQRFVRFWRRVEMIAELGVDEGMKVPLSVNILGRAGC